MVEARNLTRHYGEKRGVADINFNIAGNGLVGLLGPNGAGKSTIMKLIATVLTPTSGSITVAGVDAVANPAEACRHIGYSPEMPPLYPDMTVYSYLAFVARIRGLARASLSSLIGEVMERTGIAEMSGRLIKNLSKGYRQRVGLAQALTGYPEILILDEPTAGLDPRQISSVRALLLELSEKHTIIISSHILSEISLVCEKAIIINQGRVAAEDTITRLSGGEGDFTLTLKAEREAARAVILSVKGVTSAEPVPTSGNVGSYSKFRVSCESEESREAVFYALAAARMPALEIAPSRRTLEQVFLEITGGIPDEEGRYAV